jgi:hypothetical protein
MRRNTIGRAPLLLSVLVFLLSVSASACWDGDIDAEVDLDDRVAVPRGGERCIEGLPFSLPPC